MSAADKLGILGGIAWSSTVDYYAGLCRLAEADPRRQGPGLPRMPEIAIESLNLAKAFSLLGTDDDDSWSAFDAYHREALLRLERAGATVGIMAANTPHHRFGQITRGVRLRMINLFELLAQTARREGFNRVTIMGTETTMRSGVLLEAFAAQGITARFPERDIQRGIIELLHAIHSGHADGATGRFLELAARDRSQSTADCIALACTELPALFPAEAKAEIFESGGVVYMDSLRVHVAGAYASLSV